MATEGERQRLRMLSLVSAAVVLMRQRSRPGRLGTSSSAGLRVALAATRYGAARLMVAWDERKRVVGGHAGEG